MRILFLISLGSIFFSCSNKATLPPKEDEVVNVLYDCFYPKDFFRSGVLLGISGIQKINILKIEKVKAKNENFYIQATVLGTKSSLTCFGVPSEDFVDAVDFEVKKEKDKWSIQTIQHNFHYSGGWIYLPDPVYVEKNWMKR